MNPPPAPGSTPRSTLPPGSTPGSTPGGSPGRASRTPPGTSSATAPCRSPDTTTSKTQHPTSTGGLDKARLASRHAKPPGRPDEGKFTIAGLNKMLGTRTPHAVVIHTHRWDRRLGQHGADVDQRPAAFEKLLRQRPVNQVGDQGVGFNHPAICARRRPCHLDAPSPLCCGISVHARNQVAGIVAAGIDQQRHMNLSLYRHVKLHSSWILAILCPDAQNLKADAQVLIVIRNPTLTVAWVSRPAGTPPRWMGRCRGGRCNGSRRGCDPQPIRFGYRG